MEGCIETRKERGRCMLKVDKVSKSYDKKQVLHDIQMEVERRTIHGLIGKNGSGKTTLIKCITGIYKPEQGDITLEGKPIYENPAVKERIGYVADSNDFFPRYRLGKMVEFYRKIYPKFDEEKIKEMNVFFGLDMNRRVSELSKGQKMRLAFMLNMAANTDILVLDEPTSGLDALARTRLLSLLIEEVEKRELTVLISSHHLGELEKVCDSITMIDGGRATGQEHVDTLKEKIRKINLVFQQGVPEGFLQRNDILTYSQVGNIYTVIFEGLTEEGFEEMIKIFQPLYTEELPVNLEEMFVYTHGGEGNEKQHS